MLEYAVERGAAECRTSSNLYGSRRLARRDDDKVSDGERPSTDVQDHIAVTRVDKSPSGRQEGCSRDAGPLALVMLDAGELPDPVPTGRGDSF